MEWAFLGLALMVAAIAAVFDHRTGHIPNWLTLGSLTLAVLTHVVTGASRSGFRGAGAGAITAVSGALLCSVVPLLLYRLSGMGGGDLKLLAAVGALCGANLGLQAQMYAFVVTLLYAPVRLVYEGRFLRTLGNILRLVANPFLPRERRRSLSPELMTSVRFAPSVAVGVLGTVLAHWSVR